MFVNKCKEIFCFPQRLLTSRNLFYSVQTFQTYLSVREENRTNGHSLPKIDGSESRMRFIAFSWHKLTCATVSEIRTRFTRFIFTACWKRNKQNPSNQPK